MILQNESTNGAAGVIANEFDGTFIGDQCEVGQFVAECASDMHNLTVALARFEHRCIVESAAPEALNEGVKEWFDKAKTYIANLFKRFASWVTSMYERIRNAIFGPRLKWLEENEAELKKLSDFGDAKIKVGDKLDSATFDKLSGDKLGAEAMKYANGKQTAEEFRKQLKAEFGITGDDSYAVAFRKSVIGEEKETPISAALVTKMIAVVKAAKEAAEDLPSISRAALANAGVAEHTAAKAAAAAAKDGGKTGDEIERSKRMLEGLQLAQSEYASAVNASISVFTAASKDAMSVLVRALHAGKHPAVKKAVSESGTLLAA